MAHVFWCGDDESYQAVVKAEVATNKLLARIAADNSEMPDLPPVWSKEGDTATIKVFGSLMQGNAGWMRYYGVTGYTDILDAFINAIADESVKKIVMLVESPGGATNGLQELADQIAKLSRFKPVFAHTENQACSAGYWLMCSANTLSANPMAQVGSIGCISTLKTYVRGYEENGIDTYVSRSGQYKGLGRSDEAISDLAKSELDARVKIVADMFAAYVGKRRGRTAAEVDAEMGQGRVFLGKEALAVGLVDKVATYEQTLRAVEKS